MKVILAGATGALGVPLVRQLVSAGHDVVGITRGESGERLLTQLGATAIRADVLDRAALLDAAGGIQADAVMHQLTALKKAPAGHGAMRQTNVLRTTGTEHLLELAKAVGARRFVTQSIVLGYGYRDHGSQVLTEESPFGQMHGNAFDAHVRAMVSAEQQVFEADGIEGIALRYGLLYGAAADQDKVARMLRKRALPVARHGGYLPFIHHDDAAAATVAVLERGASGQAYNIVDDTPATFRDLVTGIARARNAPEPLILPGWLLKLAAPYGGVVLSDVSLRVSNARAKRELGWSPAYPSYADGLADAVNG
ncbi:hypothetical protein GCM10022239_13550 [Leifsonia bigeumensis]|uniref:NAD-dependent epimerase/dehydratase domain-containing protein n=1 Tax=Leifsonella bigeumensis TaxID=433643 RepID=A0ABP7FGQ1_9MICO